MPIEYPRGPVGPLLPAALTVAMAMAVASAPAPAQPVGAVSSTRAGTTASNAREPQPRHDNEIYRFMERVLAQRDAAPWRRLGDFVLRETYSFELDLPP